MSLKLAIDFGTTNSAVAVLDDLSGQARLVSLSGLSYVFNDERRALIPSLLYVLDGLEGKVLLGQQVLDAGMDAPRAALGHERLFRNFKRGILAAPDAEPRLIDGVPWTDRDAGKRFVKGLLAVLPGHPQEISELVLTVPVGAYEGYLSWLSQEMGDLPAELVRIVDESTAAALGYSITEPGTLVLVIDFGGGSLDLSLVQLPESRAQTGGFLGRLTGKPTGRGMARVISKYGVNLGGSDIDHWLLAEVLRRLGLEQAALGAEGAALLSACETLKIELSVAQHAGLQFRIAGQAYNLDIQRADLEAVLVANNFFSSIQHVIDRVLHVAHRQGIFKEDLQHVLLIGGTSLIPSVQDLMRQNFDAHAIHVEKPFTAVVEGALQLAAGMGLEDYLVHGYGLRYLDLHSGEQHYDEIIPMGSRYPTSEPVEIILGAAHAGQQAVEFLVGEIAMDEVSSVQVKYEAGQPVFVAQASPAGQSVVPINMTRAGDLRAHLSPPGQLGEERLAARFIIDENRQLRLTVEDLHSRQVLLQDVALARLGDSNEPRHGAQRLSGYEPFLAPAHRHVEQRVSLRRLGTLLNVLPPGAISLEAAAECLRSDEFYLRYATAELLSRRTDREARQLLVQTLQQGTPPQRASVAHHLHRLSWFVAEPLFRLALVDLDERVQESAIYSLCQLGGPNAGHLLAERLESAGDALRLAAAWGLSRNPDPYSVPALAQALVASDPEVRALAVEVLAATRSPAALPLVLGAFQDQDLEVRYAATLSWIELEEDACFPALAAAIQELRGAPRRAVLRGLFHATNYLFINIAASPARDFVLAALANALQDELPAVRLAAAMPLAFMKDSAAAGLLLQAFQNEQDILIKDRMLFAAVQLMSPVAPELLRLSQASGAPELRKTAAYLLSFKPGSASNQV